MDEWSFGFAPVPVVAGWIGTNFCRFTCENVNYIGQQNTNGWYKPDAAFSPVWVRKLNFPWTFFIKCWVINAALSMVRFGGLRNKSFDDAIITRPARLHVNNCFVSRMLHKGGIGNGGHRASIFLFASIFTAGTRRSLLRARFLTEVHIFLLSNPISCPARSDLP